MIEGLLSRWGTIVRKSAHIPTWTEDYNLAFLAEHASKAQCAVELGSYMGRSAKVMLDAGCQHLWAVDNFQVFGTMEICQHFLKDYIDNSQCELIKGDSNRAAEMLIHMRGKIDFAWCDDGHAEEDLIRDINAMLPLLKDGAVLCGHDWEGDNDVARGVKRTGIKVEIPVPRMWMHIKGWPIDSPKAKSCCGR